MAKKQTRRSISVSRTTYERLKAFCEANNISMSQLVETRVNDFLGEGSVAITPITPRPTPPSPPRPMMPSSIAPKAPTSTESAGYHHAPSFAASPSSTQSSTASYGTTVSSSSSLSPSSSSSSPSSPSSQPAQPAQRPSAPVVPMTSAAARYAVEPPPPIIKPKQQDTNAPKPAEKRPDQIFTF